MTMNEQSAGTLESAANETRHELADSVDELRIALARQFNGGDMVETLRHYAVEAGGADFVRNLGQQVRDNPLPVTLVGAGIAWLALSGRRKGVVVSGNGESFRRTAGSPAASSTAGSSTAGSMSSKASAAAQAVGDTAGSVRDSVSATAHDLRDKAASMRDTVADTAADMRDRAADIGDTISSTAADLREGVADFGDRISAGAETAQARLGEAGQWGAEMARDARATVTSAFKEHPVLIGAVGLVLGAAVAALLPTTEAEEELAGEVRDELRAAAGEVEAEVREAASEVRDDLKETAQNFTEKLDQGVDLAPGEGDSERQIETSKDAPPMAMTEADMPDAPSPGRTGS